MLSIPTHLTTSGQLSVRFNQDFSRIGLGMKDGFEIWDLHPLQLKFKRNLGKAGSAGIGIVEPLYRTNVVAIVGGGDKPIEPPRKVMFWDDRQNNYIAEISYNTEIRNVRLRRDRIFVVLESAVFVYPLRAKNLEPTSTVSTVSNPRGLFAISTQDDVCVFACPGKGSGTVYVENTTAGTKRSIESHSDPDGLGALALSDDGRLLATTDLNGHDVRVFDVTTGNMVVSFRRGASAATVHSLSFSSDKQWICMATSRRTVHIFGLGAGGSTTPEAPKVQQSSLAFLGSLVPPSLGGAYFNAKWSFAQIRVNDPDVICCFGETPETIMVISATGTYARYVFDVVNGGEGKLVEEKKFFG